MLSTLFGRPRGIFIPCRTSGEFTIPNQEYTLLKHWFSQYNEPFLTLLEHITADYSTELTTIGSRALSTEPRWDQEWFTGLDAVIAYGLVRRLKPKKIIEIGCGHSTRFLAKAIADQSLTTEMIGIDPRPRPYLETLPITLYRTFLQGVPLSLFTDLTARDIVFVDSSHIGVPGSDVDRLFSAIIPMLPSGVYLHFHDIFLPHDYPAAWKNRGYNEQQVVIAALGGFRPIFASHYVRTYLNHRLADLPFSLDSPIENSLWLEKDVAALK